MEYKFDELNLKHGIINVKGWVIPSNKDNFTKTIVRDEAKKEMDVKVVKMRRPDVGLVKFGDRKLDEYGFFIENPYRGQDKCYLTFREYDNELMEGKPFDSKTVEIKTSTVKLRTKIEDSKPFKSYRYIRMNGKRKFLDKAITKLFRIEENNYQRWFKYHATTQDELVKQAKTSFAIRPKFSIIVPVYNTPERFLKEMVDSVRKQSYSNWQLCLANGSGDNKELNEQLKKLAESDPRICYTTLKENLGIAGNTNAALALAEGDFIALLDHDDFIAPNALFEFVKAINEDSSIDVLYSDEDKVDQKGKFHFFPHFKPDFNMDLLLTNNYICHFFAVRKNIVDKFGGFRSEYDGAQDYDFILRSIENTNNIKHIPKILYHWRSHMNSTAENPESKMYAYEAGRLAIEDHYKRVGIPAKVKMGVHFGYYNTVYQWEEKPLVSIIIPNKDHITDLDQCIRSLYGKLTYKNFEVIVVENNSEEKETFEYYDKIQKEFSDLKVVYWDGIFNYSAINNFGVTYAKGEYLLLLNNDTEVIAENLLESMLGYCMREDVGIVGAKLYYKDDTIQHAGVIIGVCGVAGHAFQGLSRDELGYMGRATCSQNFSAVTGACMMVKKSIYDQVGGLTEEFAVAFNDIDFCLKVEAIGKRIVFDVDAELYHYESKSRGFEDTPEKQARFNGEISLFNHKWEKFLEQGDPYYNPNLSYKNGLHQLEQVPIKIFQS